MKIGISLSGYAGSESDLVSLKNPVPNGDYHYFGDNPITHTPTARRLNEQLNQVDADDDSPSGIKRRKKVKAKVNLEKEDDGLGEPAQDKRVLPESVDMYYGLKPLEHNPISNMVLHGEAADFGSRFGLYEDVWFQLNGMKLPAKVLAVMFMEGKVLYTLGVYTGFPNSESYKGQYGIINSIAWDDAGREYMRINAIDSVFVEPREIDLDSAIKFMSQENQNV